MIDTNIIEKEYDKRQSVQLPGAFGAYRGGGHLGGRGRKRYVYLDDPRDRRSNRPGEFGSFLFLCLLFYFVSLQIVQFLGRHGGSIFWGWILVSWTRGWTVSRFLNGVLSSDLFNMLTYLNFISATP